MYIAMVHGTSWYIITLYFKSEVWLISHYYNKVNVTDIVLCHYLFTFCFCSCRGMCEWGTYGILSTCYKGTRTSPFSHLTILSLSCTTPTSSSAPWWVSHTCLTNFFHMFHWCRIFLNCVWNSMLCSLTEWTVLSDRRWITWWAVGGWA